MTVAAREVEDTSRGAVPSLIIESVATTLLDVPLTRPHRVAAGTITAQAVLLVRVRTASGIEGIGEAVVPGGPWWGGESIEGVRALIDGYLAPLLIGQDAARSGQLMGRLNRAVPNARWAKAALEMALWDARGKALGVPVYELLGGLFRESIPVTWALGADPAPQVIDEIERKLADGGHASFKLKMGGCDAAEDLVRVTEIASVLAGRTSLRVDLNGSWDELTARRYLPRLEDAGIELVEQPVAAWNVEAMARLADLLTIPLMADESLITAQDAARLVREHACDVFAVKIAKCGGLAEVQRIGAIAETAGLACHGGTTIETSIGTAAALHVFCASPAFTAGCELFGPLLLAEDVVTDPLASRSGALRPPAGPGLGITLDEDKIAALVRD